MKRQNILRFVLFMILLVSLFQSVHALGVSPARRIEKFADGPQTFSFKIINSKHQDFDAIIYAQGDLAKYVTLEKNNVHVSPNNDEITIQYTVDVPQSERKPGNSMIDIIIEETSGGTGATVSGKLSVTHQLVLKSPYTGSYASAKFSINSPDSSKDLMFTFALANEGTEKITEFTADVELIDADGHSVAKNSYTLAGLEIGEERKDKRAFDQELLPGNYHVTAKIQYSGKVLSQEADFVIGGAKINVENIGSNNFQLGRINEINVSLFNDWSEPIDNVFAEVIIKDKEERVYGIFKTVSASLQPFTGATVFGYWNTKDIAVGNYIASVRANYVGKTSQEDFDLTILPDEFRSSLLLSGNVVAKGTHKSSSPITPILALSFIVLLIVNIVLFLRARKNRNQPPPISPPAIQSMIVLLAILIELIRIL